MICFGSIDKRHPEQPQSRSVGCSSAAGPVGILGGRARVGPDRPPSPAPLSVPQILASAPRPLPSPSLPSPPFNRSSSSCHYLKYCRLRVHGEGERGCGGGGLGGWDNEGKGKADQDTGENEFIAAIRNDRQSQRTIIYGHSYSVTHPSTNKAEPSHGPPLRHMTTVTIPHASPAPTRSQNLKSYDLFISVEFESTCSSALRTSVSDSCATEVLVFSEKDRRSFATQRFVPDSLKLRNARFEHAHRRFAEQSHIDHGIKLCPLFVDLGDRARSGVQKSSNSVCTDIQWESSSHQHLQIRQLSDEVAAKCS